MVDVIKGKGPSVEQKQQVDIGSAEFGAKVAIAALSETKTQKSNPAQAPATNDKVEAKTAPTGKSIESRQGRSQSKSSNRSKSTEKKTEKLNATTKGNATGLDAKSNKQLTQRPVANPTKAPAKTETAWDDPNEITTRDDEVTALEKRVARAQEVESQIESTLDVEIPLADLTEADGLNGVSQPMRDYGNYGALETNPDLLILMNGISDSFDNLISAAGIQMPEAADLTGAQLAEVFAKLNLKKKKTLSEEEKEAELILAGAVAILAVPKIQEKLEELGLEAAEAISLQGVLEKLIEEVKQDDHPYHHLYTLIKEETEYSIVPEDPESIGN